MSKIDKQKEVFFNNLYEFCIALLQSLNNSVANQEKFVKFLENLPAVGAGRVLLESMKKALIESTQEDQDAYKEALAFLKFTKQQWDNLGKEGKDITFN